MKRTVLTAGVVLSAFLLIISSDARAGWVKDGALVTAAWNTQRDPQSCTDGAGGTIIVWEDRRINAHFDIYVQRLDPDGNPMWTTDGVPICIATGDQNNTRIIADGMGGAIIVWEDPRAGDDIYAQRVDGGGTVMWDPDGVEVCIAAYDQLNPALASDGAEGAIVAWQDYRNNAHYDIYAQRIDGGGGVMWTPDGEPLCMNDGDQIEPVITTDMQGGAIVTWLDGRTGNDDVYAQRVDDVGNTVWQADGEPISTVANDEDRVGIISDLSGGAVIAWQDHRTGVFLDYDIYAQRIDGSGAIMWTPNGEAICTATQQQFPMDMLTDGQGGAFIVWQDNRAVSGYDIYVQRISGLGFPQWAGNGQAVCTKMGDQNFPTLTSDGADGVLITWSDYRSGSFDIYAQRVDVTGLPRWTADGVVVCGAAYGQFGPQIVSDGAGGALIAWYDYRDATVYDVYAQRIEKNGKWGNPAPQITVVLDVPGDQGGVVALLWLASRLDPWPEQQITTYSIWRAIAAVAATEMIENGDAHVVDQPAAAVSTEKTTIRVQQMGAETFHWELIDSQIAQHLEAYSKTVPTLFDSTAVSPDPHYFQVIAHTEDPLVYWISNVGMGRSLDNLSPSPPLMLSAQRTNGDVDLEWNPSVENVEDLLHYAVYRSESSGFLPDPQYLLVTTTDTLMTDTTADPAKAYFYITTAVDVHDNESEPSNEANVDPVATAIGDKAPRITSLTVLPNSPNPFSTGTTWRVGVPSRSDVTIEVYDVAGRRVFTRQLSQARVGWREVYFDGRDSTGKLLPSGVYMYRVSAAGVTRTQKMVIAR